MGFTKHYPQIGWKCLDIDRAIMLIECPSCGSPKGFKCARPNGKVIIKPHNKRIIAVREVE